MSQGEAVSPNPPINLMSSSMATFSPTGAHAQLAHSTNTIIQGSPPDTAPLNSKNLFF